MKLTNQYVAGFLEFNGCFMPVTSYRRAAAYRVVANIKDTNKVALMDDIREFFRKKKIDMKKYKCGKTEIYYQITTKLSLGRFIIFVENYCKFKKPYRDECMKWANSEFGERSWKKAEG